MRPEWKLRDSYVLRLKKEQKGYHIDDHLFTTPRPLDPLLHQPGEYLGSSWPEYFHVPYSFSMTGRVKAWKNPDKGSAESMGLGDYADIIIDVLNNLYSVPTDARLPLGFEPLSLRRMRSTSELDD